MNGYIYIYIFIYDKEWFFRRRTEAFGSTKCELDRQCATQKQKTGTRNGAWRGFVRRGMRHVVLTDAGTADVRQGLNAGDYKIIGSGVAETCYRGANTPCIRS